MEQHWKSVKLNDKGIFSFENGIWVGKKPPFKKCKVIRNTNFTNDGHLDLSNVAFINIEDKQFERKLLYQGDIIIERSGGGPNQPVGRVALFDLVGEDYCFSNFTSRLRIIANNFINYHYLHLFLFFFHIIGKTEALQRRTTGIRNLAFEGYKKISIPLPPLPEQRAIFNVLKAIQEAKEARRREVALERERKAALMEYLFTHGTHSEPRKQTEIGEIPQSWRVVRLGDAAPQLQYGLSLPGSVSGAYPILRMNNLAEGKIDIGDLQYVELSKNDFDKFKLFKGDLLFNRTNSPDLVGKISLFDLDGEYVFASYLIRIKINNELISSSYANGYLNLGNTQQRLKMIATRGVSQSNINATKLSNFLIPLPLLSEQKDISEVLSKCDAKIIALEQEVALLEELFRAMLEELMRGQLSALPLVEDEVRHE